MLTPELIKEIHENAVAHGWWEGERDIAEIYALIHSELSEALEEYRSGKEMIYYVDGKPEGIAVELADAVIRILDYIAASKYFYFHYELYQEQIRINGDKLTLPRLIVKCHARLVKALALDDEKRNPIACLADVKSIISEFLSDNGLDLYEIIRIKHEYNKTRPYRHGGKLC